MFKWIGVGILAFGLTTCTPATSPSETVIAECGVGQHSQAEILALQVQKYQGLDMQAVNQIALDLLPCLGHPNPDIRDGLFYESLSGFLRAEQLTDATKLKLFTDILTILKGPDQASGFLKTFAALSLSELARADRVAAYLSDDQRQELVQATSDYMSAITDYRGFTDGQGWRHGVAHSADLILQLSLNPKITPAQFLTLQAALGTQIAPSSGHAYIHGEPERMARAALYLARRGEISQEGWSAWFAKLADPAPFKSWNDVYSSEAGLAKLHNTKAFLSVVYINATETKNANIKALLGPARAALIKLP